MRAALERLFYRLNVFPIYVPSLRETDGHYIARGSLRRKTWSDAG